jgi:hypothetical protein
MVTQEIKRDIIFQRMNLPSSGKQVANPRCMGTHLDQVLWWVISYLQYIGLLKYKRALTKLQNIQEININDEDKKQT